MSMLVSLQDVSKTYKISEGNTVNAVCGASLEIDRGEFVIITGRSGSGKTTLLNLAAGLTRPSSGKVLFDGMDLWGLPDKQQSALRNQKIGFIFKFPSLLPALTTLENVMLPGVFSANHRQPPIRDQAMELLRTVGLSDKLTAHPRQLSAGQQQRVVVARSLINQPEILLADEATSDLDEQTEYEIMELLKDLHAKTGITILMVTHTSQLVSYGTRALQMVNGILRS
jgi:ABC-type lipoprotein export system ATPase subunit